MRGSVSVCRRDGMPSDRTATPWLSPGILRRLAVFERMRSSRTVRKGAAGLKSNRDLSAMVVLIIKTFNLFDRAGKLTVPADPMGDHA
ncbi:MAG: hypothetical protein ABF479_17650 [Gluconacetobacter sp.]|uniref:Uncharacterized protein n=1 Tax=Gluconacetobacter dulcium TaxID=2729096 RepID=A0A7W4PFY1_9PROT|nr:hypothetical protein [Gluconacetobacter dulcium]MBB2196045.1 hypothetical protein [Gluconacetobacter dulcium]